LQTVRHRFNIYARSCVAFGATTRRWAPPTRYTLRRNTACIMKGLVWYDSRIYLIFVGTFHPGLC